MKNISLVAGLLLAAGAATLRAQTLDEVLTYGAIASTPVGALPPMLTNTMIDRLQNGASFAVRYGHLDGSDFVPAIHGIGVTGILPAGLGSTITVTGGMTIGDCDGCKAELMLGVGGDLRLTGMSMGTTSTSPLFTVSLAGDVGYGNADPGSFFSGYVGVPVALVQRGSGMQFVPFITPGFSFARTSSGSETSSGSGFMLGGGLGIYNSLTNVTVNVGVQHVFISSAQTMIGLNLIVGGK
jgi:hypothetical protein